MNPLFYAGGALLAAGVVVMFAARRAQVRGDDPRTTRLRLWTLPLLAVAAPLLAVGTIWSDVAWVLKIAQLVVSTLLVGSCIVSARHLGRGGERS